MITKTIKRTFDGRTIVIENVPAEDDPEYGKTVSTRDANRAELLMAAVLVSNGPCTAKTFCWCRSAIGLSAKDLAKMLDVTPETVSRWENGRYNVDFSAWLVLGTIVLEAVGLAPVTVLRCENGRRKKWKMVAVEFYEAESRGLDGLFAQRQSDKFIARRG